jgi:plastocyanin
MKKSILLASLGIFSALQLANAGDITGVITFKGARPAEIELADIKANSDCSPLYSGAVPSTKYYIVSAAGGLADVVVSLKDVTGKSTGAGAAPVVIDQKGCLYQPQLVAVQTGQKIIVKNSDPCIHNVHDVSKAGNTEHNDPQMPGGADLTYTFDKAEPFLKFKCDIHPWMFAWVTVVDSPYFSVSDKDGKFTIKNVPPGKYTLEIAHRKLGTQTAAIEVKDSGATQNFTFESK